jgi:hypothetical protein
MTVSSPRLGASRRLGTEIRLEITPAENVGEHVRTAVVPDATVTVTCLPPHALLAALVPLAHQRELGVAGLFVYTFNQVAEAERLPRALLGPTLPDQL